jgi:FSR family fosmidomycin resistance protein-like MFS transporter
MEDRNVAQNLAVFGLTHTLIDAACAGVALSLVAAQQTSLQELAILIVLYNFLAFACQVPLGFLADKYKNPRATALLGSLLVAFSTILLYFSPILAVITAGIGNALFHIGGGTISLNLIPEKATAPGIFVAPGALGIFAGTFLAKTGSFNAGLFFVLILIACLLMAKVKIPKINYQIQAASKNTNYLEMALLLIFISVAVRSFVGSIVAFPWKSDISLAVAMVVAVFLGKALGGVLADRYGWRKIAAGALLLSAPLITFGAPLPIVAILGMFLFNMTMPVTLTAISNMLPGRPAFAFGLTCLALFIGAFPVFTEAKTLFVGNGLILAITLTSVLALFYGLGLFFKSQKNPKSYYN